MFRDVPDLVVPKGGSHTLNKGEYLIAEWPDSKSRYGNRYSCHRSLKAARKMAKKMKGTVYLCSRDYARYRIVEESNV